MAKGDFWTVFGMGPLSTGTSGASSRGKEGFYRHFGTGTLPTGTSGAPSRGKGRLLAGLRHSDLAYRYFRGILAEPNNPTISLKPASKRTSTGLWHRDLAYRYLRGIPAWRRGLLDGLWHGDHAHR